MAKNMYDLLNDITVQLATNQPLTKSVLKAAEAGYTVALVSEFNGSRNLVRVILFEEDGRHVLTQTPYAQTHIDTSMMAEYVNDRT